MYILSQIHNWKPISDSSIIHHWRNPENHNEEAWVHPDFYQDNGTPLASSGEDMEYVGTYLKRKNI